MKRVILVGLAIALTAASFVQLRLTSAQEGGGDPPAVALQVVGPAAEARLAEIAARLDTSDSTTERFHALLHSEDGKLAIAGYINAAGQRDRDQARAEAFPRFADHHFDRGAGGKLTIKSDSLDALKRWIDRSQRLGNDISEMRVAMRGYASRMDDSTEAGGLFKRLLNDPQAPVAVLMNELDGDDVISRYLSEALDRLLVDAGNGNYVIVQSRRSEAEQQIERLENASNISDRLGKELRVLASEYAETDQQHRKLVAYLNDPMTAVVAAMMLAEDHSSPTLAANHLVEHFESVSTDTAEGLKITEMKAWEQMEEIYSRVDRADSDVLVRIRAKLAEISSSLSKDDPLAVRLAKQMNETPLAVILAVELPYSDADAGEELKALLSDVLTESGDTLAIRRDREQEVAKKARELLQVCRQIRRYAIDADALLDQIADRKFVGDLGDAGRYLILNEVRRFAERHQPDAIGLMRDELLEETQSGKLRVRDDRGERVRELIRQAERVRAEEAKDDF